MLENILRDKFSISFCQILFEVNKTDKSNISHNICIEFILEINTIE